MKINLVSSKAEGLTLDACAKTRKHLDPISFVISIRKTVCTENSHSCQTNVRENLYWKMFIKLFRQNSSVFKIGRNNRQSIWKPESIHNDAGYLGFHG
jgi:recombinational DNA repair protein (RecF pathway)